MSAPYGKWPSPLDAAGHQTKWDSTSLGWLKLCPRLYYYSMICGYVSKHQSIHLRFGIIYHAALELYDRRVAEGSSHEDALRASTRYSLEKSWDRIADGKNRDEPWQTDHNLKTRFTLVRSVVWYLEEFRDDAARTLILDTGKPAVELSFQMDAHDGYTLSGHLDRVVEYQGGYYVMDRKTTTTTPGSYYFDQYEPDNQMSLYALAARVIYSTPVRGVIIDACQIAVGFTRFVRGMTYRTPRQTAEWLTDFKYWTAQAKAFNEAGYYPQNDKACSLYGGCTFRKVCSRDPSVRQAFLDSEFTVRHWNPLEERG